MASAIRQDQILITRPTGFDLEIGESTTRMDEAHKKECMWRVAGIVGFIALAAIAMTVMTVAAPWMFPAIFVPVLFIGNPLILNQIFNYHHIKREAESDIVELNQCKKNVLTDEFKAFVQNIGKEGAELPIAQLREVHRQFREEQFAKTVQVEADRKRQYLLERISNS